MKTCNVILPCYNPQKNFAQNIVIQWTIIESKLKDFKLSLMIVNDGTQSEIFQSELAELQKKLPDLRILNCPVNQGKGAALRHGFQNSQADYYVFTDVDFPYMTDDMLRLVETLSEEKVDVVVGVRDEQYYQQVESFRKILSKTLRSILRYTTGIPVSDTQCGIKGFNNAGKEIFLKTKTPRYLFDLEFIFSSQKNNLAIRPMQVSLRPGIKLSKLNYKIIFQELFTFLNIFVRNIFQ